ncbi:MAG TPA: TIGR01777 family oxidoreductase [Gemmatimonadales bacterium]|nr:TIGR01777 family oxidoreductase [Gemmatimonadales bacterium]
MKVLVAGGTGFIGGALTGTLVKDGHQVRLLTRRPERVGPDAVRWDPEAGVVDRVGLAWADAVVNLAGATIARRWTPQVKREIRASRVDATQFLAIALATLSRPPQVLVSASAIGYYGNHGDELVDETSPPGEDFLSQVTRDWESAAAPASAAGIRVVLPRIGLVVAARGGLLAPLLPIFRLGLGGPLASGHQWWSWITLNDLAAAIAFALRAEMLQGPVNAVAPHPVTNADFASTLGRVLGRPAVIPVPGFALRLRYGEAVDGALLTGCRVSSARLVAAGFIFRSPELEPALRSLLN